MVTPSFLVGLEPKVIILVPIVRSLKDNSILNATSELDLGLNKRRKVVVNFGIFWGHKKDLYKL